MYLCAHVNNMSHCLQAFGLHDHEEPAAGAAGDGHAHSEEEEEEELLVVWRSCVVILGMYAFFLFEFVLHSWTGHSHSIVSTTSHSHSDSEVCHDPVPIPESTEVMHSPDSSEE